MGIHWGSTHVLSFIWMNWTWEPTDVNKVLLNCDVLWLTGAWADVRCSNGCSRLMNFIKQVIIKASCTQHVYACAQLAFKSLLFLKELKNIGNWSFLPVRSSSLKLTKSNYDLVFELVSRTLLHFALLFIAVYIDTKIIFTALLQLIQAALCLCVKLHRTMSFELVFTHCFSFQWSLKLSLVVWVTLQVCNPLPLWQ